MKYVEMNAKDLQEFIASNRSNKQIKRVVNAGATSQVEGISSVDQDALDRMVRRNLGYPNGGGGSVSVSSSLPFRSLALSLGQRPNSELIT